MAAAESGAWVLPAHVVAGSYELPSFAVYRLYDMLVALTPVASPLADSHSAALSAMLPCKHLRGPFWDSAATLP